MKAISSPACFGFAGTLADCLVLLDGLNGVGIFITNTDTARSKKEIIIEQLKKEEFEIGKGVELYAALPYYPDEIVDDIINGFTKGIDSGPEEKWTLGSRFDQLSDMLSEYFDEKLGVYLLYDLSAGEQEGGEEAATFDHDFLEEIRCPDTGEPLAIIWEGDMNLSFIFGSDIKSAMQLSVRAMHEQDRDYAFRVVGMHGTAFGEKNLLVLEIGAVGASRRDHLKLVK